MKVLFLTPPLKAWDSHGYHLAANQMHARRFARLSLMIGLCVGVLMLNTVKGWSDESGIVVDGQSIMGKVFEKYSSLSSYQDEGEVLSEATNPPGSFNLEFKTYFKKPNLFRFDWSFSEKSFVVWSDGSKSYFYGSAPYKIEAKEDIGMAVAGATGSSFGAVHSIPSLFMKEVGGRGPYFYKNYTLIGEEMIGDVHCFHLTAEYPSGQIRDVWVGKDDFLIRKIKWESMGTVVAEIHRDVRINSDISQEIFNYQPPQQ